MKPKFSIKQNNLVFTLNGQDEAYKLPYPATEMVGLTAFSDDLNRRIAKHHVTADMIKTNSHNVFIQIGSAEIRVKFPNIKGKHLLVSKDTHKEVKLRAVKAKLSIDEYVRLMLVQCKSDVAC